MLCQKITEQNETNYTNRMRRTTQETIEKENETAGSICSELLLIVVLMKVGLKLCYKRILPTLVIYRSSCMISLID